MNGTSVHLNALLHDYQKGHPILSMDAANLLYILMRENFQPHPFRTERINEGYYRQFFAHPEEPNLFAESMHKFDFGPGHCAALIVLDSTSKEIVVVQHTEKQTIIPIIQPINEILALRYQHEYGLTF